MNIKSRLASVRGWTVAVVAVLAGLVCRGTWAQGTSNSFPDPLTSRQVDQFAELLGMDSISRLEIDPFHEAYREQFRSLRDGRIQEYLNAGGGGGPWMLEGPQQSREDVESRVKERGAILKAIERLDAQFLDQLQTLLDEAQAARMPVVRRMAERARAKSIIGAMLLGSADVDLSTFVRELPPDVQTELSEEQRSQLDAATRDYEQKLTTLLVNLADESVSMPLAQHDAVAASNITRPQPTPGAPPDRDAMDEYFTAISAARASAMEPQRKLRQQLVAHHHSFLARLKTILPAEPYREVRSQFYKRSYNEAWPDHASAEPLFTKAGKLSELTQDEQEGIAAARSTWESAHDAATTEMVQAVDDFRKDWNRFMFDDSKWEAHRDRMESLQSKRQTVNDAAAQSLRTLLGDRLDDRRPELAERPMGVQGIALEGVELGEGMVMIDDGGGAVMFSVASEVGGPRLDAGSAFLPAPISERDVSKIDDRLALSDDIGAIIDVLHQDYQSSFTGIMDSDHLLKDDGMGMVGRPGEPFTPPSARDIEQKYAARKAAFERILQLDQEFFDGIAALLQDEAQRTELESLRRARSRSVYNRGRAPGGPIMVMGPMGPGGTRESSTDLVEISESVELSDAGREIRTSVIGVYEPEFIESLRRRYETVLREQKEVDLFHAKAMVASESGETRIEISDTDDGFRQMQEAQQRIAAADEAIAALNRRTIDDALGRLEESDASALRLAWQKAAYPSVFRDARNAEPTLVEAIKLETSTPEQVQQISEILQKHRAEYDRLCQEMVRVTATAAGAPRPGEFNPDTMRAMAATQNELKRLRFDRTELNAASLRKLKALLTPEQIEQLPGLKEKKETPESGMIFFGP